MTNNQTIEEMESAVEAAQAAHAAANATKFRIWDAAVVEVVAQGRLCEHDGDRFWDAVEAQAGATYVAACAAVPETMRAVWDFLPIVEKAREEQAKTARRERRGTERYSNDSGSGFGMNTDD